MENRDLHTVPTVRRKRGNAELDEEIARLVQIERSARSGLMKAINRIGVGLEGSLEQLSGDHRAALEKAVISGLELSYKLASGSHVGAPAEAQDAGKIHRLAATATGAAGGFGGLPATIVELPATITVMFRAVQSVARAHGEDMNAEETRIACLKVFGSGGPSAADDGAETAFVAARLGAVQSMRPIIAMVAPRLAAVFGQKLAAQAVPIVGALAGATINYAFMDYYEKMAQVQFGLRRLARGADAGIVAARWQGMIAEKDGA